MKLKFTLFSIILCILYSGTLFFYESLRLYYAAIVKPLKHIEYAEKRTTGSLKILTNDHKLIFMEKYSFVDELGSEDITDLHIKALEVSAFDIIEYYRKNYFPKLSSLTHYNVLPYVKILEEHLLNNAAKEYLLEKYSMEDLYRYLFNRIEYSDNVVGVGGLAHYLCGENFSQLDFKTQMFLIFTAINILEKKERTFSEITAEIDGTLWKLYEKGVIDNAFYRKVVNSGVHFKEYKAVNNKKYQKLIAMVKQELKINRIDVKKNNYDVYLGYDDRLNAHLQQKISDYIKSRGKNLKAAYAVIDYDKGVIRGIFGIKSRKYRDIFSRPLYMKRQTGSIFKPFVYVTAFENGVKPYDYIVDRKGKYLVSKSVYSPKNYDDFYMGRTYVRNGLIYSLNNATVKLAIKTGLKNVALTARAFGLEPTKAYPSMPLGVIPYTVLEMAQAYSIFANNGVKRDITFIDKILKNGQKVNIEKKEKRIVSEKSARIIIDCMKDVVRLGTARGTGLLKGTAGKTGTTNNYRDAWFVGVFKPYVVVVWVGYDNMKSMGEEGTGGSIAAPLVANLQKSLYSDMYAQREIANALNGSQ